MHPTLALSVVLLSWCFFRNRTMGSRSLLGAVLVLLGWEPAASGNQVGQVLILIAIGAAISVIWELSLDALVERRATAAAGTVPAATVVAPPAPRRLRRSRRKHPVPAQTAPPTVPPPPGAVRAAAPMPPVPETATATPERYTELERAEAFGDLLEANLAGLVDAYRTGDVRAQAAFAGEIADVARGMETVLRVVVGERHRVHGIDVPRFEPGTGAPGTGAPGGAGTGGPGGTPGTPGSPGPSPGLY
jgi:hypothetical protein